MLKTFDTMNLREGMRAEYRPLVYSPKYVRCKFIRIWHSTAYGAVFVFEVTGRSDPKFPYGTLLELTSLEKIRWMDKS